MRALGQGSDSGARCLVAGPGVWVWAGGVGVRGLGCRAWCLGSGVVAWPSSGTMAATRAPTTLSTSARLQASSWPGQGQHHADSRVWWAPGGCVGAWRPPAWPPPGPPPIPGLPAQGQHHHHRTNTTTTTTTTAPTPPK